MQPIPAQGQYQQPMTAAGQPNTTPFAQPLVYEQPPSQAAKVIGILIMVYGGLSILGGIISAIGGPAMNSYFGGMDPEFAEYAKPDWYYFAQGMGAVIPGIGYIFAGWLTMNFKKKGIHFTWGVLAIAWIIGIILAAAMPYPEMGIDGGGVKMFAVGTTAVCGLFTTAICGLLAAIPLFFSNNGLD